MIGKFLDPKKLSLRTRIGTCSVDGKDYEMQIILQTNQPIIESLQTGKKFTLTWEDIFELAIQAGIDKEVESESN